jgi:serine kinase of HPr protein (carbohydrate metabolism regulator)
MLTGVIDDGKGIAFLGVSGAGKSALANLWKSHPEVAILSDDRVIIRKEKEKFLGLWNSLAW